MTHASQKNEMVYDPSKLEAYLELNLDTKNSILYSLCGATTDTEKGYIRKKKSRFLDRLNGPESNEYEENLEGNNEDFNEEYNELVDEYNTLATDFNTLKLEYKETIDELIGLAFFQYHLKYYLGDKWETLHTEVVEHIRVRTNDPSYKFPIEE